MNWDQIEGNWKQAVGKAKEKWGRLTDDQWTEIGGSKDRLVGKIQEVYGTTRDEAERQVTDWQYTYEPVAGGYAANAAAAVSSAADSAADWWYETRRTVNRSAETVSTMVEERPLFAIGCAVGIGLILGLALGRR